MERSFTYVDSGMILERSGIYHVVEASDFSNQCENARAVQAGKSLSCDIGTLFCVALHQI